ncbi:type IV pilin protein [Caldimonas tepidiphila]|uniref:type IV pilin protein n=1 Tax=Caldimonas tepidiphila TaxID=2315841 RepID=UPI001300AB59|nr:type IV pilin protein [Caldimonas tepidiphila]
MLIPSVTYPSCVDCFISLRSKRGFTLIELMVVVAIAGILAAVAYPSFMSQVRSSRRADAVAAITAVQQAQERWRANNATYTDSLASLNAQGLQTTTSGTTTTYFSPNRLYTITVTTSTTGNANRTGYTVTATAASGTSQAADSGCTVMAVVVNNGTPTPSQPNCWRQ